MPFLVIDEQVRFLKSRGLGVDADTDPTLMLEGYYLNVRWHPVRLRLGTSIQSKSNRTGIFLVLLMHIEVATFPYVHGGLRDDSCGLECICLQV